MASYLASIPSFRRLLLTLLCLWEVSLSEGGEELCLSICMHWMHERARDCMHGMRSGRGQGLIAFQIVRTYLDRYSKFNRARLFAELPARQLGQNDAMATTFVSISHALLTTLYTLCGFGWHIYIASTHNRTFCEHRRCLIQFHSTPINFGDISRLCLEDIATNSLGA